jgi:hypothetical protein
MVPDRTIFDRSVREQIARNLRRTPTERFRAFCDLLDAARALAPTGVRGREQRARAHALRQRDLEQMRANLRHLIDTGRVNPPAGV